MVTWAMAQNVLTGVKIWGRHCVTFHGIVSTGLSLL